MAENETASLEADLSKEKSGHRHRKKKRHRHRSRGNTDSFQESGSHEGAVHTDDDVGDERSEDNENIVMSSSIRRKRSKSSSRKCKDAELGNDSGLSLGNSLSEASPVEAAADPAEVKTNAAEKEENNEAKAASIIESKEGNITDSAVEKQTSSSSQRIHHSKVSDGCDEVTNDEDQHRASKEEEPHDAMDVEETRKANRIHRRLERQKTQYKLEKQAMKKRLDDTKAKFEKEISRYEQDLTEQRHQFLEQLSTLRLQEQYESLSGRIHDLGELETELNDRFRECQEQETDIEEVERFLNLREELCKSKEMDLSKLDDELDAWRTELDIKKRQLEMEDPYRKRNESMGNTSYSKPTTEEEDYILKKNLIKCQADLSQSQEENTALRNEMMSMKKQLEESQLQRRNQEKKIKQLESQLAITVSQLNHKSSGFRRDSLPPISDHHSQRDTNRIEELRRERESARSQMMLQRLNNTSGDQQLSINQQAALRRKLAGKDGSTTRSASSTRVSSRLKPHDDGLGLARKTSASAGSSRSTEEGTCSGAGQNNPEDLESRKNSSTSLPKPSTEGKSSTVCVIM
ncbi:uncharacterized protein [Diadema antillarum]|uniref:uncharacterized protein n=1 Tax=Diadema antillarum TaxID=105358 RepID=UPI003A849399